MVELNNPMGINLKIPFQHPFERIIFHKLIYKIDIGTFFSLVGVI